MTDDAEALVISSAGVYNILAEDYHRDPVKGGSLSSSGARLLMSTCPARFRYEQDHPAPPSRAMNLGSAAHREVLGVGPELVLVEAADYRTKDARAARDEALDRGAVPLLPHEYDQVQEMAAALRRHELASVLLGGTGAAEQALVWQDRPTRVWRRALLDWLPPAEPGGQLYLADYKTSESAHPDAISKAIWSYGYHAQAAWYADGVQALELAAEVAYFLVVQEKTAPYLVSVVQVDQLAMDAGRHHNRAALELYARCRRDNHWPPYVEGLAQVSIPGWAQNRFLQEVTS